MLKRRSSVLKRAGKLFRDSLFWAAQKLLRGEARTANAEDTQKLGGAYAFIGATSAIARWKLGGETQYNADNRDLSPIHH